MEAERWQEIERLYYAARKHEETERARFLEQCCAGDESLQREVESLLAQREESGSFLNGPALEVAAKALARDQARSAEASHSGPIVGTTISHYRILEKLSEGGMGEVWLAEQKEPMRRRVALKLVKAGMNTREVMARFESERQALALMDHPAIAKVFDAGSTPQGAPYFVMEYVAGVPITAYSDNHKLSTRERLELFIHVCQGVQHAHQKAVIHRDLKPSNILVMEADGRAAPKIIDFGVAKALAQRLTEQTMYTLVGTLVGTPEYMSPEQAVSSGEDIDTRTDVYSLGVIFYELLAGVPPLDLRKIALDEFLRRLREEEPLTPSTKIRTHDAATSTELARRRQTDPLALTKQMRGDLDSIALKALEKDRGRRYSTPSDFAADIGRYLRNEAVLAVPASFTYRAGKFARRHRAAMVTACAFALVLIVAALVSIGQSIRANREAARANREAAVAQAVNDFLQNDLLAQASASTQLELRGDVPFQASLKPDPHLEVRAALDRAATRIGGKFDRQPEVEAAIRDTMGQTYMGLGLYPEARTQFERALDLRRRVLGVANPETIWTFNRLGMAVLLQGKYSEAEALFSQALEFQRLWGARELDNSLSAVNLASVYDAEGKYAQAEALYSQTLETERRVCGPECLVTTISMAMLATVYQDEGKYAQAEALQNQALEIQRRVLGPENRNTVISMNHLTKVYDSEGKYAQAEALHSQVLEIQRRVLGPEHPQTLTSMNLLANDYSMDGKYTAAKALHRQTIEMSRRVLGPDHPQSLYALWSFTWMFQREDKYAVAETYAAQALAGLRHALGSEHPETMASAADLALAYVSQGKFAEAEPLAREAMEVDQKNRPDGWQRFRAESLLGASLAGEKKYAEAEPLLLEGYQGMLARKDRIDAPNRYHLDLAHQWIVQLYQAWDKPVKAAEWKKK